MSKNLRSWIGITLGVAAVVCAVAVSAPAGEMDAAAKALAKLDEDWSKAAATRDAEKVAAFYAEDVVVYPPGMPAAVGKAAATTIWKVVFFDPSASISWKSTHAEVSKSGELGFTSGTYELSYKGDDGKVVSEKGKSLCIWKKQADGSWKAIHDMWNTNAK